jgi:cytochrome c oxidase subunit 2
MRNSVLRLAAISFCIIITAGMIFSRSPRAEAADSAQVVQITADKYAFTPAEIHVQAGTRVQLEVKSVDKTHGLKLDPYPEGALHTGKPGLRFDQKPDTGKIKKNETGDLTFTAAKPGVYDFKCSVVCGFGHGRMKGKLIVDQ